MYGWCFAKLCCVDDETPWCGTEADKLYLQSGQFTSTLKDSESVTAIRDFPNGISWDGTNTPWSGLTTGAGIDGALFLQSGQFTSTVKDSETVDMDLFEAISDISWDGTNTPWAQADYDTDPPFHRLKLQSGQFTSTLKTSLSFVGTDLFDPGAHGISYSAGDTPYCNRHFGKLFLLSGQFTSTIKDSESVTDSAGISWDGTNTPWTNFTKLLLQSGQFTSTVKTSQTISSIDSAAHSINTNKLAVG